MTFNESKFRHQRRFLEKEEPDLPVIDALTVGYNPWVVAAVRCKELKDFNLAAAAEVIPRALGGRPENWIRVAECEDSMYREFTDPIVRGMVLGCIIDEVGKRAAEKSAQAR